MKRKLIVFGMLGALMYASKVIMEVAASENFSNTHLARTRLIFGRIIATKVYNMIVE